jgi:hypothetical protein
MSFIDATQVSDNALVNIHHRIERTVLSTIVYSHIRLSKGFHSPSLQTIPSSIYRRIVTVFRLNPCYVHSSRLDLYLGSEIYWLWVLEQKFS